MTRTRMAGIAGATLAAVLLVVGGLAMGDASPDRAALGQPVPDFKLTCTEGNEHELSSYLGEGKVVVLEWFNPDCPFVVKHHELNRTMAETAERYRERGVVWLAINSGAPGKQGHGQERNARAVSEWEIPFPVLLDPTGEVGRAFGARVTPHMFVIDGEGKLVYQGAIDDDRSRRNRGETNYVQLAIEAALAGDPVETPETRAYG